GDEAASQKIQPDRLAMAFECFDGIHDVFPFEPIDGEASFVTGAADVNTLRAMAGRNGILPPKHNAIRTRTILQIGNSAAFPAQIFVTCGLRPLFQNARSSPMPNLPDIIEIGYSWKRLAVLLAGGIALTAGSAVMAFHLIPDLQVDAFYTA